MERPATRKRAPKKQLGSVSEYTVGIITALAHEKLAVIAMLDEEHMTPLLHFEDPDHYNTFSWGKMGEHNVAVVSPGRGMHGKAQAAHAVAPMLRSLPEMRIGLLVGIGAGIPREDCDIRLGDVAISVPGNGSAGVYQYDASKAEPDGEFERIVFHNNQPDILLNGVQSLQAKHGVEDSIIPEYLQTMAKTWPRMAQPTATRPSYLHQDSANDRLFPANYQHVPGEKDCGKCDHTMAIQRPPRDTSDPIFHYGVIASGDIPVSDSIHRDELISRIPGCICFETEAAGVMNQLPCLMIRGICDYADSHKNELWQGYAAAVAAGYAKELLGMIAPADVEKLEPASAVERKSFKIIGGVPELQSNQSEREGIKRLKRSDSWDRSPDSRTEYSLDEEERHISFLAKALLQRITFRESNESKLERFFKVLPDYLQAFAIKLGFKTDDDNLRTLMVLTYRCSSRIAAAVRGMRSQDIMVEDKPEENETPPENLRSMEPYWNAALESRAYEWLLSRLQREITLDYGECNLMADFRKTIIGSLPQISNISKRDLVRATEAAFLIHWDPATFFHIQEFEGPEGVKVEPSIAVETAFTLTGSATNAQAVTCQQYLCQTWPFVGEDIIRLLKKLVLNSSNHPEKGELFDGTSFIAWTDNTQKTGGRLILEISGTQDAIIEIAEQLAWLGAAFQESPLQASSSQASVMSLTTSIVTLDAKTTDLGLRSIAESAPVFTIEFEQEKTNTPTLRNGTCWHALFRNPVVVKGFPIPFRSHNEVGLELSFEAMAFLAETPFATRFDDSLILKGFATMFFPTARVADSVMWHFLHKPNGSYLPYHAFREHGVKSCGIETAGLEILQTGHTRNFVGWTSSVKRRLGTNEDSLYKDIDWAGVPRCVPGCALDKVSISVSKIVSVGATISRPTSHKPEYITPETYVQHVTEVRKWIVLIYDTETSRGWLVDGASALLHILRKQLTRKPFCTSKRLEISNFHHPAASGAKDAAMECLLDERNWPMPLLEDPQSYVDDHGSVVPEKMRVFTFKDAVSKALNTLQQIHDRQEQVSPELLSLSFERTKLEGFEFMDIADTESVLKPRAKSLSNGKTWLKFAAEINAITLFGTGFDDLMVSDENSCCSKVPSGKEYLAVPLSLLEDIKERCRRAGQLRGVASEIAKGCYWAASKDAFAGCELSCRDDDGRLSQRIKTSKTSNDYTLGSVQLQQHGNGAVIFGK